MALDARSPSRPPPLPSAARRGRAPRLAALTAALALGGAAGVGPAPVRSQPAEPDPSKPQRPADFVLLQERIDREGPLSIGIYSAVADPAEAGLWRVKIWRERRDRVTVATDMVRCLPPSPMRVTSAPNRVILRWLNPGGPITPANRFDHLLWWAVCQPAQAGKDPATLGAVARQLGFPGTLVEREEVVTSPTRPGGGGS